jgi:DNA recombination protein RmuC
MDLPILLIFLGFTALILWAIVALVKILKPAELNFDPQSLIDALSNLGGFKAVLESLEGSQRTLSENILQTQRVIDNIKADYEARKKFDDVMRNSVKRLEEVVAGSQGKGFVGENILREALKSFPPEMVVDSFRIKGKEVEFGMILANKKIVPIDSKWTSSELLESLANEQDETEYLRIVNRIENEVCRRVDEVVQYIDPDVTVPWAVAAIPDAVFSVLKSAHINAYRKGVIVIPYSLALPYLLTLFNLHLQYSTSLDVENLSRYLIDIRRNLGEMEEILENRMVKATTMLTNASSEYRQKLAAIKDSLVSLESFKKQK